MKVMIEGAYRDIQQECDEVFIITVKKIDDKKIKASHFIQMDAEHFVPAFMNFLRQYPYLTGGIFFKMLEESSSYMRRRNNA